MEATDNALTELTETKPNIDGMNNINFKLINQFWHMTNLTAPLRIKAPGNAPSRVSSKSRDNFIKINAFSPSSFAATKKLDPSFGNQGKVILEPLPGSCSVNVDGEAQLATSIRDYTMLAFSSRRAGT